MAARASDKGITYVAFTATPKAKTLELFGRRPDPTQPASATQPAAALPRLLDAPGHRGGLHPRRADATTRPTASPSGSPPAARRWTRREVERVGGGQEPDALGAPAPLQHQPEGPGGRRALPRERPAAAGRRGQGDGGGRQPQGGGALADRDRQVHHARRAITIGTLVAFSGEVDDKESGPEPFTETSKELNPDLQGPGHPRGLQAAGLPHPAGGQQVPDRLRPAAPLRHVRGPAARGHPGGADPVAAEPRPSRQGHHLHPRLRQQRRGNPEGVQDLLRDRRRWRTSPTRTSSSTSGRSSTHRATTTTSRSTGW